MTIDAAKRLEIFKTFRSAFREIEAKVDSEQKQEAFEKLKRMVDAISEPFRWQDPAEGLQELDELHNVQVSTDEKPYQIPKVRLLLETHLLAEELISEVSGEEFQKEFEKLEDNYRNLFSRTDILKYCNIILMSLIDSDQSQEANAIRTKILGKKVQTELGMIQDLENDGITFLNGIKKYAEKCGDEKISKKINFLLKQMANVYLDIVVENSNNSKERSEFHPELVKFIFSLEKKKQKTEEDSLRIYFDDSKSRIKNLKNKLNGLLGDVNILLTKKISNQQSPQELQTINEAIDSLDIASTLIQNQINAIQDLLLAKIGIRLYDLNRHFVPENYFVPEEYKEFNFTNILFVLGTELTNALNFSSEIGGSIIPSLYNLQKLINGTLPSSSKYNQSTVRAKIEENIREGEQVVDSAEKKITSQFAIATAQSMRILKPSAYEKYKQDAKEREPIVDAYESSNLANKYLDNALNDLAQLKKYLDGFTQYGEVHNYRRQIIKNSDYPALHSDIRIEILDIIIQGIRNIFEEKLDPSLMNKSEYSLSLSMAVGFFKKINKARFKSDEKSWNIDDIFMHLMKKSTPLALKDSIEGDVNPILNGLEMLKGLVVADSAYIFAINKLYGYLNTAAENIEELKSGFSSDSSKPIGTLMLARNSLLNFSNQARASETLPPDFKTGIKDAIESIDEGIAEIAHANHLTTEYVAQLYVANMESETPKKDEESTGERRSTKLFSRKSMFTSAKDTASTKLATVVQESDPSEFSWLGNNVISRLVAIAERLDETDHVSKSIVKRFIPSLLLVSSKNYKNLEPKGKEIVYEFNGKPVCTETQAEYNRTKNVEYISLSEINRQIKQVILFLQGKNQVGKDSGAFNPEFFNFLMILLEILKPVIQRMEISLVEKINNHPHLVISEKKAMSGMVEANIAEALSRELGNGEQGVAKIQQLLLENKNKKLDEKSEIVNKVLALSEAIDGREKSLARIVGMAESQNKSYAETFNLKTNSDDWDSKISEIGKIRGNERLIYLIDDLKTLAIIYNLYKKEKNPSIYLPEEYQNNNFHDLVVESINNRKEDPDVTFHSDSADELLKIVSELQEYPQNIEKLNNLEMKIINLSKEVDAKHKALTASTPTSSSASTLEVFPEAPTPDTTQALEDDLLKAEKSAASIQHDLAALKQALDLYENTSSIKLGSDGNSYNFLNVKFVNRVKEPESKVVGIEFKSEHATEILSDLGRLRNFAISKDSRAKEPLENLKNIQRKLENPEESQSRPSRTSSVRQSFTGLARRMSFKAAPPGNAGSAPTGKPA